MLSPSLTLTVVRETVTDTSFDTNPTHPTETTSNAGSGHSAYLCWFCNYQQHVEAHRLRLRIRRSQVRVLPSALLKVLHTGDFSYLSSLFRLAFSGSDEFSSRLEPTPQHGSARP